MTEVPYVCRRLRFYVPYVCRYVTPIDVWVPAYGPSAPLRPWRCMHVKDVAPISSATSSPIKLIIYTRITIQYASCIMTYIYLHSHHHTICHMHYDLDIFTLASPCNIHHALWLTYIFTNNKNVIIHLFIVYL